MEPSLASRTNPHFPLCFRFCCWSRPAAAAVLTTRGQQRDLTGPPPPQVAALFWGCSGQFLPPRLEASCSLNGDFLFSLSRLPVSPVETSCFGGAALVPTDKAAGQAAPDGKGGEAAGSPGVRGGWWSFRPASQAPPRQLFPIKCSF